MSSCREITRNLASDELSDAELGARISTWLHLLVCRHCRRYAQQLRDMRKAARKLGTDDAGEAAGDLERRIVDGLLGEEDSSNRAE